MYETFLGYQGHSGINRLWLSQKPTGGAYSDIAVLTTY
jgi:hypothetical protein